MTFIHEKSPRLPPGANWVSILPYGGSLLFHLELGVDGVFFALLRLATRCTGRASGTRCTCAGGGLSFVERFAEGVRGLLELLDGRFHFVGVVALNCSANFFHRAFERRFVGIFQLVVVFLNQLF